MIAHTYVNAGSLNNDRESSSTIQSLSFFSYTTVKNASYQSHSKYYIQNKGNFKVYCLSAPEDVFINVLYSYFSTKNNNLYGTLHQKVGTLTL